jgi:hypothetical protein
VAAGDFNGDRHLDLAIESWEDDTVLVLQGDGKAAFAVEPRRLAVGRRPYYKLRAGDLNNDGKDDLVTTNADGSSVSVLCTDRSGALRPAKAIPIAKSPFAVAIGNVNGDRYPDLAIVHRWGSVDPKLDALTILIGSGDCVFTPTSKSPLKVGASPPTLPSATSMVTASAMLPPQTWEATTCRCSSEAGRGCVLRRDLPFLSEKGR